MEQVENPMILPQYRYRTQEELDAENEAMAEKGDRDYEDSLGEEN